MNTIDITTIPPEALKIIACDALKGHMTNPVKAHQYPDNFSLAMNELKLNHEEAYKETQVLINKIVTSATN